MAAETYGDTMNVRRVEQVLFAIGLLLLMVWGGAWLYRTVSSRNAVAQFEEQKALAAAPSPASEFDPISSAKVDFKLWSPKRVAAFEDSLEKKTDLPIAILRIPQIELEVPVYNDTDDLTLNRGVGRILGTARVGEGGNLGIAGHRDGFFRGLKDIGQGAALELEGPSGIDEYIVDKIRIVKPEDTSVLAKTPRQTLTLVTCYPFYYVGNAPERYIVTASLRDSGRRNPNAR